MYLILPSILDFKLSGSQERALCFSSVFLRWFPVVFLTNGGFPTLFQGCIYLLAFLSFIASIDFVIFEMIYFNFL